MQASSKDHELLDNFLISEPPTPSVNERLGDEQLWVVSNCTVAHLVALFMNPVHWVSRLPLPGGGFHRLKPHFVIEMQCDETAPGEKPVFQVSGINDTAVLMVRVPRVYGFGEKHREAAAKSMSSEGSFSNHAIDLSMTLMEKWDSFWQELAASPPDIDIIVAAGRGYGHTQIVPDQGDPHRASKVASFLLGAATDYTKVNDAICNPGCKTHALVVGADRANAENQYRFRPLASNADLAKIPFLYQGTEAADDPACEYIGGPQPGGGNEIIIETGITKDY